MNKRLIAILLAVLMLTALLPAAAIAEGGIIVNLGSVRAGSTINLQIATTGSGTAALISGSLPDNCSISTEERDGSSAHYLKGTPELAGVYEFTLEVTDTVETPDEPSEESANSSVGSETVTVATLTCSITVLPSIPSVTAQDLDCFVGEDVRIKVQVSTDDQGQLSYQWYWNDVKDNLNGSLLEGKTERELAPDTEFVGTSYYYCIVTNSNQGMSEAVASPVITVSVTEPVITSISITSLPTKLEYTEGDTLDTTGLTLLVHYSNGMAVTDDEGFTCSPTKLTEPGTVTIKLVYQNNELSFPVIVSEAKEELEAIAVTSLPSKREYHIGDRLDTTGLALDAITNKGNHSGVSSGFSCSPEILSVAGVQTITVSYQGKTTSFSVTVKDGEKTVEQIEIQTMPTKLSYTVGDVIDTSGLTLRVKTDKGYETVNSGFTCSPSRFTREGTRTVNVSYGGKTCSFEVNVTGGDGQPQETAKPEATEAPDSGDEDGRTQPGGRDSGRAKRAGSTALLVIIFAALVALVALLAYIYVTKKDAVIMLWQRLLHRADEDPNDEDDPEDDQDLQ